MQIRIRQTGQVLLEHEWIKWVAITYEKSISALTAETITCFDSDPIFEGPQASGGNQYQYSQYVGVEEIEGQWYTKYVLGPIFVDLPATETEAAQTAIEQESVYKAMKDAEQAKSVRESRKVKLSVSDWTQLKDAPVDQVAWTAYRQALRDITTQGGFPWTLNWPTEPI